MATTRHSYTVWLGAYNVRFLVREMTDLHIENAYRAIYERRIQCPIYTNHRCYEKGNCESCRLRDEWRDHWLTVFWNALESRGYVNGPYAGLSPY